VKVSNFLIVAGLIFMCMWDASAPPSQQVTAKAAVVGIRIYQQTYGRLFAGAHMCKFQPTCSHYGQMAIQKYGIEKGLWMTTGRILRCNPFSSAHGKDFP
jgi:uncharacterized protein